MKRHIFPLLCLLALLYTSCHKDKIIPGNDPTITEKSVETQATKIVFNWTVDYPGMLSSVVEISQHEDMSEATRHGSETATDNKDFTVTVDGLSANTTYYYRYVAWNSFFSKETEAKAIKTVTDAPKVATLEIKDVTRTTATVTCEVTDDCGSEVTERGVCWGTTQDPTLEYNHLNNGDGIGTYSITLSDLQTGLLYHVRAYAKNSNGIAYGDDLYFKTGDSEKPQVTTSDITDIEWFTAVGGGEVTDDGDASVTERGICWSTSPNPDLNNNYASNGTGTGPFTVQMTELEVGTTYYVRAYAKNAVGTSFGEEVHFETKDMELATVTTLPASNISFTSATCGGEVTTGGGSEVTERGVCWSTSPDPSLSDNHATNGSGTGSFTVNVSGLTTGKTYYVRAYAINSIGTSYGEPQSFTTKPLPQGAINGLFTINSNNDRVLFSKGNLQYSKSSNTWKFANNQWSTVGNAQDDNHRDLFGWGTSGWISGAMCYRPWDVSTNNADYYPGGDYHNDLTGNYAQADWGVFCPISNGGNQAGGLWRTLTKEEWIYVFNLRDTPSGLRFAKAQVNGVDGVILLPDDWSASIFGLNSVNISGAFYNTNPLSSSEWTILQQNGAVFLPAAGYRHGNDINYNIVADSRGYYWSSSSQNSLASSVYFTGSNIYDDASLNPSQSHYRSNGLSVRLVYPVE